jgi:hypothetical protein
MRRSMKHGMMIIGALALVACAHAERPSSLVLDDGTTATTCSSSADYAMGTLWVGDERVMLSVESGSVLASFQTADGGHVDLCVDGNCFSTMAAGACAFTIDPAEGDGATSGSFACVQIGDMNGDVRDVSGTFVVGANAHSSSDDPRAPWLIGGIIGGGGVDW